jgi:hypothetical protein
MDDWGWEVRSRDELHPRLKGIRGDVPPRGVGRKTEHGETYVMRDLAWTLANTTALFESPLSIVKGESPDFDVRIPGQTIGVEVTDAIPTSYAQAIAFQNREFRDRGEAAPISWNERGWIGDEAEREWAQVIANAVAQKLAKLNGDHWRRQDQNWLAVYDVAPQMVQNLARACDYLRERLAELSHHDVTFDRIFIERPLGGRGNTILMVDAKGSVTPLALHQP